jgi:hypothetical protein
MTTKRQRAADSTAASTDPEDLADLELMSEAEREYRAGKGGPIAAVFARVRHSACERS